jgi:hypothetical protein
VVRGAVMGSARALRRYARGAEPLRTLPPTIDAGPPLTFSRVTVSGRRMVLEVRPEAGAVAHLDGERVTLRAPGGPLRFSVTALVDEPALAPLGTADLLVPGAGVDAQLAAALAFLSYEEKLLAGSWRFLTYFGRDTLLSLEMLAPVLQPEAFEAGLGAVIDRLSMRGEVAHEETVGEEAALVHLGRGRGAGELDEPVLDHSMIDDDFLLAPVAAGYLLGRADPERARTFLARRTPAGEAYADALRRNLALVLQRARPFATAPSPRTLLALPEGRQVGDWRDSLEGLGGGRVPYGVDAVLVPAALRAAARLFASWAFDDAGSAARALHMARVWDCAADFFQVEVPHDEARLRLVAHAGAIDVDPAPALAALRGDVTFPALALDARGAPIPVMHSDDGLSLLLGEPTPAALLEIAARMLLPFPAGLGTPVGLVAANPAFAPEPATRALFTPGHYHGAVVWSWQQALHAIGLDRQLSRTDLAPPVRGALGEARRTLGDVIAATTEHRAAELWSIAWRGGRFEHVPFGASRAHHTESNAAQLWSTVYLALGAA